MKILLSCLLLLTISCKKGNETKPTPKTRAERISDLIDKIAGQHTNGIKYCSTRDIPTGTYTYDTTYNYRLNIVRYNDTMIGSANNPWKFGGDLDKGYYGFTPVNGLPIHSDRISIDSAVTELRYYYGISGLGNPVSCYAVIKLK